MMALTRLRAMPGVVDVLGVDADGQAAPLDLAGPSASAASSEASTEGASGKQVEDK